MPRMQIPRKLKPLLERHKRFKIILGGRGGAKSMTVSDIMLLKAQTEAAKILCLREFQNSIDDSVHSVLSAEIGRLKIDGFDAVSNTIRYKGQDSFKFSGMARNPESLKSKHGFKYSWVEEAQTCSYRSLKLLTPTIREPGSEIWMTANPRYSADPFSQRFIKPFEAELLRDGYYEDDLHMVIVVNYHDNPWFPEELELERKYDEKHMTRAEYDHVWLGKFYDTVENAIILPEWFDAAVDAHKTLGFNPTGVKVTSHDPSDGGDNKGIAVRHGSVFLKVGEIDIDDVNDGFDCAAMESIDNGSDYFVWDGGGMGVSLRRQASEHFTGKHIKFEMFDGGAVVEHPGEVYQRADDSNEQTKAKTNRETFFNLRAQKAWQLRDKFYKTWLAVEKGKYIDPDELISICSEGNNIDLIKSEVCRIPRKRRNDGKIQLVSKADMKLKPYELPSPGLFDSMMMADISVELESDPVEITFTSEW